MYHRAALAVLLITLKHKNEQKFIYLIFVRKFVWIFDGNVIDLAREGYIFYFIL